MASTRWLFEPSGEPAMYSSDDGANWWAPSGDWLAFTDTGRLWTPNGKPLGYFHEGWVYGNDGIAMFFED